LLILSPKINFTN